MIRSAWQSADRSPSGRLSIVIACAILLSFLAAFVVMGWIRSRQGHDSQAYASEIETLAGGKQPVDELSEAQSRGQRVFEHYCAICHGNEGRGDGFNSTNLAVSPRDFSDVAFWEQTTDERVYFAVSQGGPSIGRSVLMPAWGRTLDEGQIRDVITFVRTFATLAGSTNR